MSRRILKLSACSSNAGMETFAPLINDIVNNALLHSNSRIKQMPPQIIHILHFCGRLAAPDLDFVARSLEVLRVSYNIAFPTGVMHRMSA